MHGTERLVIAGLGLPAGFHWDVQNRNAPTYVHTPLETWKVMTYVNVAPDAHVRGREPYARRTAT
jgi:hypothetical protein